PQPSRPPPPPPRSPPPPPLPTLPPRSRTRLPDRLAAPTWRGRAGGGLPLPGVAGEPNRLAAFRPLGDQDARRSPAPPPGRRTPAIRYQWLRDRPAALPRRGSTIRRTAVSPRGLRPGPSPR